MNSKSAEKKAEEEVSDSVETPDEETQQKRAEEIHRAEQGDGADSADDSQSDREPAGDPSEDQSTDEESAPEGEESEAETQEEMEIRYQSELKEKDEKFLRLMAEFENFKKRSAQETRSRIKFASQPLALSIIAGLDSLERAIEQAKEEENDQIKDFIVGIEMVQQQLFEALKKNNIERAYPKGEPFDPNKHEAMGVVDSDEVEPDHIVEVFQAGYALHDRVIRPAMVQVAKKS